MTQGRPIANLVNLGAWLVGIIVSLAVGFSLTGNGALNQSIPWLSEIGGGIIVSVAGWIVVVLTIASVVLAIADRL
jgi:hypothetical protein